VSGGPSRPIDDATYVVGIDLGTTNSALAWAEPRAGRTVGVFPVPQLVADGEVAARSTLPSAVYLAGEHDVGAGALALPWRADERFAVGVHARRLGARIAGRLITSAKSWLCHGGVDRTAAILPWGGSPDAPRLSPVDASARLLEHLRDSWDDAHPDAPLASQQVVLTVPASFDEVARELTVQAAKSAGFGSLTLVRIFPESVWNALHIPWHVTQGMGDHFFFMWLFALNGIAYVLYSANSGEWRFRFKTWRGSREFRSST